MTLAPPPSVRGNRWRLLDDGPFESMSARHLLLRLLRVRGVTDPAAARAFLQPTMTEAIELPNLDTAVARLTVAIERGERIAVFGDYDADGMTATALLVEGLAALGATAIPYIPHRFTEGYGLNTGALKHLKQQGASLVVTVDTGTSAVAEIAYAAEHELEVIVADHHEPGPHLPDAVAIVNPHLPGTPPAMEHLSGCGVAFMLLMALAERMGRDLDRARYLDLFAIGAICDVVPLLGVNRPLVAEGLRQIAARARPGLAALMQEARVDPARVGAHTVGFIIGPRLNAAGRLEHGLLAYELLTTRDDVRARELARELEAINRRRQGLTADASALARRLADAECAGAPLVMVGDASINQGIVGLVASRLAEERGRPAIVYQRGDEFSVGSARGVPAIDVHALLGRGAHLVERFGGHHQAGGFTVRTDRLLELRRVLTDHAATAVDWHAAAPEMMVDLELPLSHAPPAPELLGVLRQLEPCGQRNHEPLFMARGLRVLAPRTMSEGRHLRMRLIDANGSMPWQAVGFNLGAHVPSAGAILDAVFSIARDRDGGAELHLKDFAAGR